MSKRQLAEAEFLDWSEIATAWGEAFDRTGSARAKSRLAQASAHAEAARSRMEAAA